MTGQRVVVAMSGGVDSSVAAALVAGRGDEAIGVTLHLAGSDSRCCSLADADDARRVAERLGIRFFVANYADRFHESVVLPFAALYCVPACSGQNPVATRAPHPGIRQGTCNRRGISPPSCPSRLAPCPRRRRRPPSGARRARS